MLSVLFGTWVLFHTADLKSEPWRSRVALKFPFATAVDTSGRIYTSDSAMGRLVALERDGSLRWTLEGLKHSEGFYNAVGLDIDSKGNLYVTNWLPAPGQDWVAQEMQIQRYDSDGRFLSTVFRLENSERTDAFPGYLSFSIQNDTIYIVHGDGIKYELFELPVTGGQAKVLRTVYSKIDFVSIVSKPDGTLVGAARNGTLWKALPAEEWKPNPIPGIIKPWALKYHPDGSLLILDLVRASIEKLGKDGKLTKVLDSQITHGTFADTFAVAANGTIVVADKEQQRLLVSPSDRVYTIYEGAKLNTSTVIGHWFTWVAAVSGGLALLGSCLIFWLSVLKLSLPLVVLQVVLFIPILILAQAVTVNQVFEGLYSRYNFEVHRTLLNSAEVIARMLSPEDLEALQAPADLDSEAYRKLNKAALAIRAVGRQTGAFSYIALYRNLNQKAQIVLTGSGTFGVSYPYPLYPDKAQGLFINPGTVTDDYSDDYGNYAGGFASIGPVNGKPVGVVEVGLFTDLVKDVENSSFASARLFATLSAGFFFLIMCLVSFLLTRSLNILRRITREVLRGTRELPVELKSRDEIIRLMRGFGPLTHNHKLKLTESVALTTAAARFVPKEFLEQLDLGHVSAAKLGDLSEREMTLMFSSFRDLGKFKGHLSKPGAFRHLNKYLDSVTPLIRESRGFIEAYEGESFTALFPRSPEDALEAFTLIHRGLASHEQQRAPSGMKGVPVTFGVHKGPMRLGILGETHRLETTVISEAVGLTESLNRLCLLYQVPCVATFETLALITNFPYRKLGVVLLRTNSERVAICEPLDELDPANAILLDHLSTYAQAFDAFEKGDLKAALEGFEFLGSRDSNDAVVRLHAHRCRSFLEHGTQGHWDPALAYPTGESKP